MHVFRSVVEKNGFCLIPLIETLKQVDICMVPVGGIYTIDSEKARQMMAQIEPKVIILMHYRDGEAGVQELAPVEAFAALYPTEMVHYLSGNAWDTEQEPLQGVVVFDAGKMRGLFRCAVFKKIV